MNAQVQTREIAQTEPHRGEVVQVGGASLMEVISRAAADPSTDVDKLERLLGMYERITAQQAKAAYNTALAELQPALPEIDRKGRIVVKDKTTKEVTQSTPFARWEDIHEAITPLLAKHGFSLSFKPGQAPDGKVEIAGILSHRDGHAEQATIALPHDSTGSKNAVQAVGSATSYGKRYVATMLLNIRTRGQDDDGAAANASHWITEDQVGELVALMDEVNADRAKFLNFLKVDTLAHLPANRFQFALKALEAKRAK